MSKRQIQLDLVTTEGYNTLVKWKDGVSFSLPAGTGSGSLFHLVPVAHVEGNDVSNLRIREQTNCLLHTVYFLASNNWKYSQYRDCVWRDSPSQAVYMLDMW